MTIGFRCTKEQNDTVTMLAAAAGMTKQDYIMSKLTDTEVTINPDTRMLRVLKKELSEVYSELCRAERMGAINKDLMERAEFVTRILASLGGEKVESEIEKEENAISFMSRN